MKQELEPHQHKWRVEDTYPLIGWYKRWRIQVLLTLMALWLRALL